MAARSVKRGERVKISRTASDSANARTPSASPSQKTTDRWDIEGKHDHFWFPKIYSYENLKWERDMIQDLRARYRVGDDPNALLENLFLAFENGDLGRGRTGIDG